jgi:predicted SnoaL-like aldol condensation-catalyzing enzyme
VEEDMPPTTEEKNKALVLEAFDTLFNKRDFAAASRFYLLMLHGRFSGIGAPADWIVLDIVRLEGGLLKEHWDVIEDEATRASSRSGLPMFGRTFPGEAPAR